VKLLQLVLKKRWFELIASGRKSVEYRQATDYWKARLHNREFDAVRFRNGYAKDAPEVTRRWLGCELYLFDNAVGANGEELDGWYYVISLGAVVEVLQ